MRNYGITLESYNIEKEAKPYVVIEDRLGYLEDNFGFAYLAVFDTSVKPARVEWLGKYEVGEPSKWNSTHPLARDIAKLERGENLKIGKLFSFKKPQPEYEKLIRGERDYEKVADSTGTAVLKRESPTIRIVESVFHQDSASPSPQFYPPHKEHFLDLKGMLDTCKKEAASQAAADFTKALGKGFTAKPSMEPDR